MPRENRFHGFAALGMMGRKGDDHRLRTPNEPFFHQNPKLLGMGRQFGQIHFGALMVFLLIYKHPIWYCESLVMFSINQLLFLQKTQPFYPNPKYLFGIGI